MSKEVCSKMKFNQDELARAAKVLALLIEKTNTIPILSHVCIRVADNQATLIATNLDQQAAIVIPCEGDDCSFTVSGDKLAAVTSAAKSGDFTMELADGFVTAKSGRSKWKLPTLKAIDFPVLSNDIDGAAFAIDSERLRDVYGNVMPAISTEETRYYLNGICAHGEEGKLKLAATTGNVLSAILCGDIDYDGPRIIIPRANIAQIIKMMANYNGPVTVTVGNAKVSYSYGNVTLSTKTIDGDFPDYMRVIPAYNDKIVKFEKSNLAGAIKRVTILADEKTKSVTLDIDKDRITINVTASDGGIATEEVPITYDGEDIKYRCNGVYLLQQIEAAGNEVHMAFRDTASPVMLTSPDNSGYVGVLMGMRI